MKKLVFVLLALALFTTGCINKQQATPPITESDQLSITAVQKLIIPLFKQNYFTFIGEALPIKYQSAPSLELQTIKDGHYTLFVKQSIVQAISYDASSFQIKQHSADEQLLTKLLHKKFNRTYTFHYSWHDSTLIGITIERLNPTLKQTISNLSLHVKVGQLLLTGIEGQQLSEQNSSLLEQFEIGGVILFKKNIQSPLQVQALNAEILALNTTYPLWISIDEEGGTVSRIPAPIKKLPSAHLLASHYTIADVEQLAYENGRMLRSLGFTINFAPVFDVNSNLNNPVIGYRAFSNDPTKAAQYGIAFFNGLQQASIISSAKHFPGHGDTDVDSHDMLPVLNKTKEQLLQTELVPFQEAIEAGIPMIMIGHLLIPSIDEHYAASQSSIIMSDLLRDELQYEGLIITDDLTMNALSASPAENAKQAILAGADIALIGHGIEHTIEAHALIKQAVEEGSFSIIHLNERVFNILNAKQKYTSRIDENYSPAAYNEKIEDILK